MPAIMNSSCFAGLPTATDGICKAEQSEPQGMCKDSLLIAVKLQLSVPNPCTGSGDPTGGGGGGGDPLKVTFKPVLTLEVREHACKST